MSLSRRRFLQGLGASALALPWLECSHARAEELARPPLRLLVVFTPNGTVMRNNRGEGLERWRPVRGASGREEDFALSPILAPLEQFKQRLLVLDGVTNHVGLSGIGDYHQEGLAGALSAAHILPGSLFHVPFKGDKKILGWGGGQTVDQYLAQSPRVGGMTALRSIHAGVAVISDGIWGRLSYAGPSQPIAPLNHPGSLWSQLFSNSGARAGLEQRLSLRQQVLAAVRADARALGTRLSSGDRGRLERHVSAVDELSRQLELFAASAACRGPALDLEAPALTQMRWLRDEFIPEIGKLQMDQIALAFACDLTRVATLQWGTAGSAMVPTWLGMEEAYHPLSHEAGDQGAADEKLTRISRWFSEQFAYLLSVLDATPEGEGSVLDHTLVVWLNELGFGAHELHNVPYVLAGAKGVLRTGRYLQFPNQPAHNHLLVSLLQLMGEDVEQFGHPDFGRGPLPGLT